MTLNEIIANVAQELGLEKSLVKKTYHAYWGGVREYISSLPLSYDMTEEDFQELRPNVNIPSLGKLYVTLDDFRKAKRNYKYRSEHNLIKEKDATH